MWGLTTLPGKLAGRMCKGQAISFRVGWGCTYSVCGPLLQGAWGQGWPGQGGWPGSGGMSLVVHKLVLSPGGATATTAQPPTAHHVTLSAYTHARYCPLIQPPALPCGLIYLSSYQMQPLLACYMHYSFPKEVQRSVMDIGSGRILFVCAVNFEVIQNMIIGCKHYMYLASYVLF